MKTKISTKERAELNFLSLAAIDKITKMLNDALNEEWLTYYQCWIGAILMEGTMRNEIKPELFIHANQELSHALLIKARMLELGIYTAHKPSESKKMPRCQTPINPDVEVILHQNLENESSAIQIYKEIADFTKEIDNTTYKMAISILNEELEHEQRIENWLANIQKMKIELKIPIIKGHYAIA